MKQLLLLFCLGWLTLGRALGYDFVVAQDGSGQFRTVQEAFNAVPDFRKKVTTIFVKKGTYKEKLILAGSKNLVRLIGEDRDLTILTYDDYNQKKNLFGEEKGTSGSASCYLYGADFTAENLTFQNSSGPVGQAVALWVAGDRMRFKNCRFLGFQDTLYTYGYGSRQYYQDCYIEGTVDFIFGSSTAWFEGCTIFCKQKGYVTAASTPDSVRYGYVFNNCRVTGDAPAGSFLLGRPWRPYAKTVFLRCELGAQIGALGWDHWDKDANKRTATYAEYQNRGPGYQPTRRVMWSRQLSDEEARQYTPERVFRNWNPKLDQ
ncbi:pectinesterase family protein [Hymenobacter jeollabukensis]|uniref:Pectinesterase n=1 Tax=Hymenobacter jeollabukensis TaxID=2025313 RepID=A0A5R8WLH8_9BACT|nr:pectinesterase family protein [Hymenobacter jeollabukensis]TLM90071.1 pectin esterase [Hymenobacter jeollabukensis]